MKQPTDNSKEAHCSVCRFKNLKALYCLNTVAKEYAESAETSYNSGMKRRARIHSQRKTALYGLKRAILGQFIDHGCVDQVRTHEIDGREYYCVYVGEFSFHTPTSEWDIQPENAPDSAVELESFETDPSSRSKPMSEREALTRLSDEFESPNKHIESPFTNDNFGGKFVGWSYLPGALEEGDRVPDRHLHDHHEEDDFIFSVGDTFQTGKGECEIADRYHAYLTPLWDNSPLLQRKAYDVLLDNDRKECIRTKRLIDDWYILANSIADPLPNVDGRAGDLDYVRGHIESCVDEPIEFEIGDIIELQPDGKDDSVYCRITEVQVSYNLLLGKYEPIPPTEQAPLGLAIHEIANDVVAVHDEPPVAGDE